MEMHCSESMWLNTFMVDLPRNMAEGKTTYSQEFPINKHCTLEIMQPRAATNYLPGNFPPNWPHHRSEVRQLH